MVALADGGVVWLTWVTQLPVPDAAASRGMLVTVAPASDEGVSADQVPFGPDDDVTTIGPLGVAPTAAQTAREELGEPSHDTPR